MMQSVYALDNKYTNQVNTFNTQSINKGILKKFSEDIKTMKNKKRVRFSKFKHIRTYKENTFKEKINNNKITINVPINTPCKFARRPLQGPIGISGKKVFASRSKSNYRGYNNNKTHKWVYNQNNVPRGHPNAHRGTASKYVLNHDIAATSLTVNTDDEVVTSWKNKNKYNNGDSMNTPYDYTPYDYTKLPVQTPQKL